MVKQLKNRYNDPSMHKRFMIGIDRAKMRLYDLEDQAQSGLTDSGAGKSPRKQESNFDLSSKFKKDFSSIKI